MSFLDLFLAASAIGILWKSFQITQKDHFRWTHVIVFLFGGIILLVLTFFPSIRHVMGDFFGVERGADAIVYISIVILVYFVLFLLQKTESQSRELTRMVREIALMESKKNAKK